MHLLTYVACILLTSVGGGADGISVVEQQLIQPPGDEDAFGRGFDTLVEDTLRELHVPGLSIAVVDNGKIVSKGYGFATLPDQKATADTQYFTASTTKAFTAAAAALLVHDDDNYPSVQWTTPINQFIRADFVLEDEYATSHTTIEDALSHRTGLPGHDLILGQANDTPSKVVQRMRHLPMTAQPRTQWQYCNMMYAVVTHLIQTVAGTHLETLLRKRIWQPLGMLSTTFTIPSDERERSRVARGYYWNPETEGQFTATIDGTYMPDVYLDLLSTAGDGAAISTVNDYALWIRALMNAAGDEESWNSSSPITRSIYHDLASPRAIIPEDNWQENSAILVPPLYALGWITAQFLGAKLVAHGGGITGFGAEIYMLPEQNYGVITMGNTRGTSNEAGAIIASKLLVQKLNLTAEGMFSHPAYGTINLTISTPKTTPSSPDSSEQALETVFYRTSVEKQVFTHISGTLFEVKSFEPHGLGNIVTGEGIVWQGLGDEDWKAYAIFEFGIDGERIERVGIELEPDMIFVARKKGERYWREGMIWFERV